MLSEMGMRTMIGGNGEFRRQESHDRERELNIYRSGSAPPTVEGSLSAFGGLFGGYGGGGGGGGEMVLEDELRSDPAYLAYYYANVNLNPRLPPPLVSKQDWLSAQRLQAVGGSIGDRRRTSRAEDGSGRSLFSGQSDARNRGAGGAEWGGDGLIGLPGMGLGSQQNSLADIFQDELGHVAPVSGNTSRPASRAAYNDGVNALGSAKAKLVQLHHASALGASMSRNNTPDPQLVVRGSSPCLPPVGGRIDNRSINGPKAFNDIPSAMGETTDLAAALSGMSLSKNGVADGESCVRSHIQHEIDDHQNFLFSLQAGQSHIKQNAYPKKSESGRLHVHSVPSTALYPELGKNNGVEVEPMNSLLARQQGELLKPAVSSANSLLKGLCIPNLNSPGGSPQFQCANVPNAAFPNYCSSGNSVNSTLPSAIIDQFGNGNVTPLFENIAAASAMAAAGMDPRAFGAGLPNGMNLVGTPELQNVNTMGQVPLMDPLYLQYLRTAEYAAAQVAALNDPSLDRKYKANSYMDLVALQKAYLEALLLAQKSQYVPFLGKSNGLNHGYCGHPNFGFGVPYPIVPNLPVGPGSPLRHSEQDMRFLSGMRNLSGGVMDSWHLQAGGNMDESFASSLLEEFKNNKTRCFELTEIAGHVVEFSADQYGSRFIQQKLETATTDEKDMVFKEIMPQVFSLMTDVFGNYVIQKFFEHGTTSQRRELADELIGHVLTLSLQMYGCRVIQKAIEVVDLDQQTKMVAELDGHVMRCVRDQNGNHVIQKCIECIPQDAIEFIVSSFYDQVVTLSTHPYGCRVIQRVLEHCDNPKTQRIMMDEILQHVCKLAKDQYGNYVVQHVLEHGKPHERSTIITKLAGQIVEMSQQKFASNVVEKCLCFGGPEERQILVNEMLGSTDENEPLQAMMKDQFANYVVQKVLETCDDQQRELILSRIKVHLNALKKYTYGKHIVARVEKLVAAGERRSSLLSLYPA